MISPETEITFYNAGQHFVQAVQGLSETAGQPNKALKTASSAEQAAPNEDILRWDGSSLALLDRPGFTMTIPGYVIEKHARTLSDTLRIRRIGEIGVGYYYPLLGEGVFAPACAEVRVISDHVVPVATYEAFDYRPSLPNLAESKEIEITRLVATTEGSDPREEYASFNHLTALILGLRALQNAQVRHYKNADLGLLGIRTGRAMAKCAQKIFDQFIDNSTDTY